MRAAAGCILVLATASLLQGCAGEGPASSIPNTSQHFRLVQIQLPAAQRMTAIRVEQVASAPSSDFGWSIARLDPASDQLSISWTDSPHAACGQADLVQVFETDEAVVIGVRDTRFRPPVACTADGFGHVTSVRLRRAVGRRALVVPMKESSITGTTEEFRASLIRRPAELPEPGCDVTGVPVGMPDASTMLAPRSPDSVMVCRYSWHDQGTVVSRISVDDAVEAAAIAARLNSAVVDPRPARAGVGCDDVERTRYSLTFAGPRVLVPVSTDAPGCGELTNGVIAIRSTAGVDESLRALFPDDDP
ncbi:hypothetical protein CLV52_0027 [Amnibacterium kyonggiense]|uniref:Uncharacterized protein n=1 Tax=Amnibacterium kyonggiense TaxID=595671 RepID=A0A4R7FPE2_9MICO|nr:hypothetical protein CLV52_0027 [Amnibacterium kyonggiense]